MPRTIDYQEIVRQRARESLGFRRELVLGAARLTLNGEVKLGRSILLDYVTAILEIEELALITGMSTEVLSELMSEDSKPDADAMLTIITAIAEHEGIEMDLQPVARDASADLVAA